MPAASIVIRAKNEGKYLGRCLEGVFRQRFTDFDVILVDSGSTDATLDIARRFPVRVLAILPERFTYGYALNVGIAASQAAIAVSLSGHSIAANDEWLGNLARRFDDARVAACFSRQICHPTSPLFEKLFVTSFPGHPLRIPWLSDLMFNNAAGAVRRALWEQFPFDEHLPACEDHAWILEARARGYRVLFAPDSVVIHSHEESFARFMRRRIAEGHGLAQVYSARGKPAPRAVLRLLARLEAWDAAQLAREQGRQQRRHA